MKQLVTGLLVSALLLVGGVPWAMATQIELKQSDGSVTKWGGSGDSAKVTCGNCSGTGASFVDDAAFTPGSDSGAPAMGLFDDVAPDSVNEGDVGAVRMSANRNLYSTIRDAAGNERGANVDASNRLLTKPTGGVTPADNFANPTDAITVFSLNGCYDGATWDLCVKGSAGAGNTDSGTARVVIAKDSAVCNAKDTLQAVISTASSGNVELVALTAGQTIYVCDWTLVATGAVAVQIVYGTGSACGTGETDMTGAMPLAANGGWTHNYDGRLKTAEANALCIELSAAVQVDGVVTYRKAATF